MSSRQKDQNLVMTTIRMPLEVKMALTEAAADDGRSSSNLLMFIVRQWLVSNGYLPAPDGAKRKGK